MFTQKNFKEVAINWQQAKAGFVKHSTMCAYMLVLKTHLLPCFGTMTNIRESDVQQFIMRKLSDGLAKKTVKDAVAVLKAIVKYGAKRKIFPFEEWEVNYPTESALRKLQILTLYHQRILMHYLIDNSNFQNIGILLALCTGMRIGEVCALRWEDVDFIHKVICVRCTVGRIYNCKLRLTEKIFSSPKTKDSFREIPVSKQLFSALKEVRKISVSPFVVGNSQQSKEPRAYRDYFTRLLKCLNIPKITFHGLRHTFATRCIESQCDCKTVSTLLGHSNITTTLNLYVHPNINQKKRCIERMTNGLNL